MDQTLTIIILGIVLLTILALVTVRWIVKRRKARAAAREKLLKDDVTNYDATGSPKENKSVYKKSALKASVGEGDIESQSGTKSFASSKGSSNLSSSTPRRSSGEVSDDDILQIVIGSWYEHLIRHSATEYLRSTVKNTAGMTEKDLVPEMRLLLADCGTVPMVRWSKLTTDEKARISASAKSVKSAVIASVAQRFPA